MSKPRTKSVEIIDLTEALKASLGEGGGDCAGFVKSGHWKGWPCATSPTVESHGYWWCRNHVPLNEEEAADAVRDRKAWEEQQAARSTPEEARP